MALTQGESTESSKEAPPPPVELREAPPEPAQGFKLGGSDDRDRYQHFCHWSQLQRDQRLGAIASELETAQVNAPGLAGLYGEQALLFLASQQPAAAVQAWEQLLRIDPHQPSIWYSQGVVLDQLGRPEAALASYDQAIQCQPTHALAWGNRAIALRKLGRTQEAMDSARQAFALNRTGMVDSLLKQWIERQPRFTWILRLLQRLLHR